MRFLHASAGNTYLKKIREFLTFVSTLWGLLGGISALFPLSNFLMKGGIPLKMWYDKGGLAFLRPNLVAIVATLVAIFTIFWIYGQRDSLARKTGRTRRTAGVCFACGLIALLLYMVVYTLMENDFHYVVMGWTSDDPRRVLFDLILLALYSAFFGLMTGAFMLLAAAEYFKGERSIRK
jgi:hypothetical protein